MPSEVPGPNWEQFVKTAQIAGLNETKLRRITTTDARTKVLKEYNVHDSKLQECLKEWESKYPAAVEELKKEEEEKKRLEQLTAPGAPIIPKFEDGKKVILLPQQETRHNYYERVVQLDQMKVEYQFEFYPGDIAPPYCRKIPKRETSDDTSDHGESMIMDIVKTAVKLGLNKFTDTIGDLFRKEGPFQDYDDLYKEPGSNCQPERPAVSKRWRTDAEFARQRLQGIMPILIERVVDSLPTNFPLKDADIDGIVEKGATIASLIKDKRLYIMNYKMVAGIADIAPKENCFTEPICLFYVTKEAPPGESSPCLMPLAIQLYQDPSKGPIFTPKDDFDGKNLWFIAKIHVQCTDTCWHECCAHLLGCHLVMEATYVAMMRTMSTRHPLSELISAHFWYTLSINEAARRNLIAPGGMVPTCMSMGYNGMIECLTRGWKTHTFEIYNIPEDIKRRGVDDESALPNYYFRDDGLRVFDSMHRYVSGVVDEYYKSDTDVVQDDELQAWVKEVTSEERVGARGTPFDSTNGRAATIEQVKLFCTEIIWACSAHHAVMNNGQYDYIGYVPNVPGIFKVKPPTDKTKGYSEQEIANGMPTYGYASDQISYLHLLSMPTTQPLGYFTYKPDYFQGHEGVQGKLKNFQQELDALSDSIKERNKKATVPYTYLDPKQIASGVAI